MGDWVFLVVKQTVLFDDGYHCSIPESLKSNAKKHHLPNHQIEMPSSDSLFPCTGNIDLVVVVFLASVLCETFATTEKQHFPGITMIHLVCVPS